MKLSKWKTGHLDAMLTSIFDAQDCDILIVRPRDCSILFSNSAARRRLLAEGKPGVGGRLECGSIFAELFKHCPEGGSLPTSPATVDLTDSQGRSFSATISDITWTDGKPATVFFLRDVTRQKEIESKLYNMAYIDQLTGVPNRQKFYEDFNAIAQDVAAQKLVGIVCIFDLDNFKGINDTYGHNTGDIMLRRLAEHLQADPCFAGHIYRLGGDEFVLLYSDKTGTFQDEAEMKSHYDQLLEGAFSSYTMPTIELSCTISMGVAFFPKHGDRTSDLLRKADIALYKAKAEGCNKKVFYEDRYDMAKKFKDVYIHIQPILDHHHKTFGHELLDQSNDSTAGSAAVSLDAFDRTIDALGLAEMEDSARYFISFSGQLLSPAVIKNLPKNKFIIQVAAESALTPQDFQRYKNLRTNGYDLAFCLDHPNDLQPELLSLAQYFKVGFAAFDEDILKKMIAAHPQKSFIATGVDTQAQYESAQRIGFKLYQGFFFNQEPPLTKKTKEINPLRGNYFRLLQLTSTDSYVDFKEISAIIASDVALSYKLLKLLNSAAVGLRNVSSIAMALAYLGEENLKKWIALLALRGIASDKPLELVRMSLIRARFGELLAPCFRIRRDPKHVFLVGMFSLLHIALEKTREELLEEIPVAEDIRLSLMGKEGVYSDLLHFFSSYEYANWDDVSRYAEEHYLNPQTINDYYIAAVKWANDLISTQLI